jgi:hypothetical protein
LLDQLGEGVDEARPLGGRELAQRPFERRPRRAHRPVDVLGAGLGDLHDRLAGRRIDGLERPSIGGRHHLLADQQPARPARDELARGLGGQLLSGGRRHAADRT